MILASVMRGAASRSLATTVSNAQSFALAFGFRVEAVVGRGDEALELVAVGVWELGTLVEPFVDDLAQETLEGGKALALVLQARDRRGIGSRRVDQRRDRVRRLAPRLRQHGDERAHAVLRARSKLLLDVGGDERRALERERRHRITRHFVCA